MEEAVLTKRDLEEHNALDTQRFGEVNDGISQIREDIKELRLDIQTYNDLINKGRGALWGISGIGALVILGEFIDKLKNWLK